MSRQYILMSSLEFLEVNQDSQKYDETYSSRRLLLKPESAFQDVPPKSPHNLPIPYVIHRLRHDHLANLPPFCTEFSSKTNVPPPYKFLPLNTNGVLLCSSVKGMCAHEITITFPRYINLKNKWIQSLDLLANSINEHSVVCSVHFRRGSDFSMSSTGKRELKYGSTPRYRYSPAYLRSPAAVKVCRVCLAMDVKLYHITDFNLYLYYEQITGLRLKPHDQYPKMLCWECVGRLRSAYSFREKALKTHEILSKKTFTGEYITIEDIKQIDRIENKLNSTLTQKNYSANDYNLVIIQSEAYKIEAVHGIKNTDEQESVSDEETDLKSVKEQNVKLENEFDDYMEVFDVEFEEKPLKYSNSSNEATPDNKETKNNRIVQIRKNKRKIKIKTDCGSVSKNRRVTRSAKSEDMTIKFEKIDLEFEKNDIEFEKCEINLEKNYSDETNYVGEVNLESDITWLSDNDEFVKKVTTEDSSSDRSEVVKVTPVKKKVDRVKRSPVKKKSVKVKQGEKKAQLSAQENTKKSRPTANQRTELNSGRAEYNMDYTLFTVTPIDLEEEIAEIEKRKETDAYKQALFKCDVCYMVHSTKVTSEIHATRHTEKLGPYECRVCKRRFKTSKNLKGHMTNTHTMKYACKKCEFVTKSRSTAKDHQMYHAGHTYQCPHCPRKSSKMSSHLTHMRIKHPNASFVCDLCGFAFLSEKGVKTHKVLRHVNEEVKSSEGPFCEQCDIRFASREAYDTHLRVSSVHCKDDDPNRIINDTFSSNGKRYRHRLQLPEAENEDISCELCGVMMTGFRAYFSHFRVSHPGQNRTKFPVAGTHMCEQCGRLFTCRSLLLEHLFTHTGEKAFKCEECGAGFNTKVGLTTHRQKHTGVKDQCPYCHKQFSSSIYCKRHISLIHDSDKSYPCEICEKTFTSADGLKQHVAHVHNKKPWPKRARGPAPPPGEVSG